MSTASPIDVLMLTFYMEMYRANKLGLLRSAPEELAVLRKQLSETIFAKCAKICLLLKSHTEIQLL